MLPWWRHLLLFALNLYQKKFTHCFVYFFHQWHQLDRAEQAKYYDQARRERAIHMQLYPGWSARENYAQQGKKKKRKRDKSQGDSSGTAQLRCVCVWSYLNFCQNKAPEQSCKSHDIER